MVRYLILISIENCRNKFTLFGFKITDTLSNDMHAYLKFKFHY